MKKTNHSILLSNLYHDLVRLSFDYDTGSEELINSFEITRDDYCKKSWLIDLASTETINYLKLFRDEWINLLQSKSYACIGVFMQLDEDWIKIVNGSLKNLIQSIEIDLNKLNVAVSETGIYDFNSNKCSKNNILKVADYITTLAIKKDHTINPFYKGGNQSE